MIDMEDISDMEDIAWDAVRRLHDKLLGKKREPTEYELQEMVVWALKQLEIDDGYEDG